MIEQVECESVNVDFPIPGSPTMIEQVECDSVNVNFPTLVPQLWYNRYNVIVIKQQK